MRRRRAWTLSQPLCLAADVLAAGAGVEIGARVVHTFIHPTALIGLRAAPLITLAAALGAALGSYLAGLNNPSVVVDRKAITFRSLPAGVCAALAALLVAYLVLYVPVGRVALAVAGSFSWLAVALWRRAYAQHLVQAERLPVVVLGTGIRERHFAVELERMTSARAYVRGFLADRQTFDREVDGIPVLGSCEDVVRICQSYGVETVVVASEETGVDHLPALSALAPLGIRLVSAATLTMEHGKRVPVELVNAGWLLSTFERLGHPGSALTKRLLDIGISLVGLSVFALLLPFLYVLVKLDSPGSFFFTQERVGLGGRTFRLYKIRTMGPAKDTQARWALQDAHRVTRVGALLRRTRLDEIPQLWNVLRGEMSIVGPRPEQPSITKVLEAEIPHFAYRTLVLPGITGWAQIHHGYAASVEDSSVKLSYDLFYLRHHSVLLDLDVMFRTFFVMLARIGSR